MIEEIKKTFIKDSIRDLESIEDHIVQNQIGEANDIFIEKVFVTTHNIKGTAPMLGINSVDHIVHPIEKVFSELRSGKLQFSKEIVSNTQRLIPFIKSELNANNTSIIDSNDVDQSLRFFDSLISKNA